ncbi:Ribosomal S4P (gammaproteobacterial) [Photobacterium malacitanum]|uniref:Ribosomal S4P (Gammaproteobacterial) n=1 Tax=Photobacterium malacitanum TaxID=2204294 RepID=A0A1Y6M8I8_9GAMM|nr:VC2046/SO_2500 family protein [Photobacterium malacitanum]SMY32832.1 Ribosomal S4P (gammaproteobacterial) [Photobacterium malacitanum]
MSIVIRYMQTQSLDNIQLINEIQLGTNLNHAVEGGRRADFALMLALLSADLHENIPVDTTPVETQSSQQLRAYFEIPASQPLTSTPTCYSRAAEQAQAFHQASLTSTRLLEQLQPTALSYPPQKTKGLPEDLFHNLSIHERRKLPPVEPKPLQATPQDLYLALIKSKRQSEMNWAA